MNNPPHFIFAALRAARDGRIAKALHALKLRTAAFATVSIGWHIRISPARINWMMPPNC